MSWWITGGRNFLKGVVGDPANPILMPDHFILEFLQTIPQARSEFDDLFPSLLPEEKARLQALLDANPSVVAGIQMDDQQINDYIQRKWNREGVYTAGPYGGTQR